MFNFVKSKRISIELNDEDKKQISSYEKINKAIQNINVIAYDIYLNDDLIGFAMFRNFDTVFFLWNYAIDSLYQGQGYGSNILKELLFFIKDNFGVFLFTTTYLWGLKQFKYIYSNLPKFV